MSRFLVLSADHNNLLTLSLSVSTSLYTSRSHTHPLSLSIFRFLSGSTSLCQSLVLSLSGGRPRRLHLGGLWRWPRGAGAFGARESAHPLRAWVPGVRHPEGSDRDPLSGCCLPEYWAELWRGDQDVSLPDICIYCSQISYLHFLADAFIQSDLATVHTHNLYYGGVNHAGRQPARQEQLGWGVSLRATLTLV